MLFKTFLLCIASTTVAAQLTNVTLPLNKTTTGLNKELYGDFFFLNRSSTLHVDFKNVNPNVSFIIFQVHSHLYNVTVYNNSLHNTRGMNGTNLGFYSIASSLDTYFIVNPNKDVDLKLYISVHGYRKFDPIPGGCSLESPGPIYPVMQLLEYSNYIFVNVAPSKSSYDTKCIYTEDVKIIFRIKYLPERNFDADAYFDGIRSMMTPEGFQDQKEIQKSQWYNRRLVSAYPGTGAIYVAIARVNKSYSVYVPTYSYGCSPLENGCELLDDVLSQFVCASLLFVGIFLCYFGHRFFKTEMFLMGLMSGVTLMYILMSLEADLDGTALVAASVISGMFVGAIWFLFWFLYAIPLVSVLLPTLNLGFLIGAIFFYASADDLVSMKLDENLWLMFALIVLTTAVVLTPVTFHANLLCCAFLGAYATLYPIDYYIGSNLKYIMINLLRRVTIPIFREAKLIPPFQWRESLVVTLWVLMTFTGFAYQYYASLGKPPFPPPPRSTRPEPPNYGSLGRPINRRPNATQSTGANDSRVDERTSLLA